MIRLADWMTRACGERRELTAYVARGHRAVGGWLLDLAVAGTLLVDMVQRENGLRGAMTEIGVFHGRLLLLLHLLARDNEATVGYDLFELMGDLQAVYGAYDPKHLAQNLRAHSKTSDRIKLVTTDSTKLTPAQVVVEAGGPVRIFSVDGGHDADIAVSDLRLAEAVLCDGGVVLLDDFFHVQWCGVTEAAIRYLLEPERRLVPFMIAGGKLFLTSRGWEDCYRRMARREFDLRHIVRHDTALVGTPVLSVWERPPTHTVALVERVLSDAMIDRLRRVKALLARGARAG